tara:strand:- start:19230 stop:20234 length:1005 start_codon:yes stop_codon:yes gene_type:complete
MKSILKLIIYPIVFLGGLIRFIIIGNNGQQSFLAFRYIFVLTNGKSNDYASKIISLLTPKYNSIPPNGVLENLTDKEVEEVISNLNNTGYHVFKTQLSPKQIEELTNFATSTPVSYLEFDQKYITYSNEKVLFDEKNIVSPRYQFKNTELIKNQLIQDLAFDQSLLRIANEYLQTKPILDIISMWWSVPFNKAAEDRAAQKFHFDMDRFKFMKFFFYLTDVDTNTGPHCYVKGSNKHIPKEVLIDRRIEDSEIKKAYPSENIVELTAPKGSIIAVDTRGFHKGKSLTKGKRLLLQLQFSNSLFGSPLSKMENISLSPENRKLQKEKRHSYQVIN